MNILELLDLVEGLTITETNEGYVIEDEHHQLSDRINHSYEITYYVTGVYNSGVDWEEIDIENLSRLKRVCETITKLELGG